MQEDKLPLKIGNRTFLLDRSDVEKQVNEYAQIYLHDKVGVSERLLVKGALNTLFLMKGIPRDENRDLLDYTTSLILHVLTQFWAENGIVCQGEEVTESNDTKDKS